LQTAAGETAQYPEGNADERQPSEDVAGKAENALRQAAQPSEQAAGARLEVAGNRQPRLRTGRRHEIPADGKLRRPSGGLSMAHGASTQLGSGLRRAGPVARQDSAAPRATKREIDNYTHKISPNKYVPLGNNGMILHM